MKLTNLLLVSVASASCVVSQGCADTHDFDDELSRQEQEAQEQDALAQRGPINVLPPSGSQDAGTSADSGPRRPGWPRTPTTPTAPTPPSTPAPPITPSTPPSTPTSTGNSATLRDPNGTYFANIVAFGEGCKPNPDGTRSWQANISGDGETFTLTFSNYVAELDNAATRNRLNLGCTINITLDTPSGYSFAVTSLQYQGYAFLDAGTTGRIGAYYSWSGQTSGVSGSIDNEKVRTFRGPMDASYIFEDNVTTTDRVYSSCGTKRLLNIETSVGVTRSNASQSAYLNVASIDGQTTGKLILKLNSRPCPTR